MVTFGFIFLINPKTEAALDKINKLRIKLQQDIETVNPDPRKPPQMKVRCMFYWDPRNTSDIHYKNIMENPSESKKWTEGMGQLALSGVPRWYLTRTRLQLAGRPACIEPILALLSPSYTPSPPRARRRLLLESPQGLACGSTQRQSTEAGRQLKRVAELQIGRAHV